MGEESWSSEHEIQMIGPITEETNMSEWGQQKARKIRTCSPAMDEGSHSAAYLDTSPPWRPGGSSREYVLRIPMRVVKATKMGRRYKA